MEAMPVGAREVLELKPSPLICAAHFFQKPWPVLIRRSFDN
jgi:hypothetical protein